MNKLLLNNEDDINTLVIEEDTQLEIDFKNIEKDIHILVEDSVLLNIIEISKNTKNRFFVELSNESRVIYNKFSVDCNDYIYVLLDGKYSSIKLNNSAVNNSDSYIRFLIEHNNINTESYLSNHGINNSTGNMSFIVDSKVNPSAMKSITKQESKIINLNSGKSDIQPNLIIDLDDVEASHSAYISDFNKDYMFYMRSRGIDEKMAQKLLVNGFLIGNLDVDCINREKILNEVKLSFDRRRIMNRDDFPIFNINKDLIYFDNGATTLKPQKVIDSMTEYYSSYTANAHRGDYDNSVEVDQKYEGVREKIKSFINADKSAEIIFTSGATNSLNMIVFGFMKNYLKDGDEVLITKSEHASNILPWMELANSVGIKVKFIKLDDDYSVTKENLLSAITPKTKVVSLAHITNVIGGVRNEQNRISSSYG